MPEDVRQALERFQRFLGHFPAGEMIDSESGFTVADGMLLVGEIEMAAGHHRDDRDNPID